MIYKHFSYLYPNALQADMNRRLTMKKENAHMKICTTTYSLIFKCLQGIRRESLLMVDSMGDTKDLAIKRHEGNF